MVNAKELTKGDKLRLLEEVSHLEAGTIVEFDHYEMDVDLAFIYFLHPISGEIDGGWYEKRFELVEESEVEQSKEEVTMKKVVLKAGQEFRRYKAGQVFEVERENTNFYYLKYISGVWLKERFDILEDRKVTALTEYVRCVNSGDNDYLKDGDVYKVYNFDSEDDGISVEHKDGFKGWYFIYRFEAATEEEYLAQFKQEEPQEDWNWKASPTPRMIIDQFIEDHDNLISSIPALDEFVTSLLKSLEDIEKEMIEVETQKNQTAFEVGQAIVRELEKLNVHI